MKGLSADSPPAPPVQLNGTAVIRALIQPAAQRGPDMTGPSLSQQVRRHCPEIAAVYLGNPGTPEGLDNLLVRPFTRDDLLERIRMAASGVGAGAG